MRELVAHLVLGSFAFQLSVPPAQWVPHTPRPTRAATIPDDAPVAPSQRPVTPSGPSKSDAKEYGRGDLRLWSGDAGAWSVGASGRTAGGRASARSSLLIEPRDRAAFTLRASLGMPVGTAGAAAGFAFGRRSDGVAGDPYLVLAWTAAPAGAEIRGEWKLSRFDASEGSETVHAHVGGSSDAYDLTVPRSIQIDSSPTHFRLLVAGEDVIDLAGSFPSGPVALYSERAAARFSDVEIEPLRPRPADEPPPESALLDEDDPWWRPP